MFNEIKTSTILTYAALSVVVVVSSHAYKKKRPVEVAQPPVLPYKSQNA
jgi:hypothetical protein